MTVTEFRALKKQVQSACHRWIAAVPLFTAPAFFVFPVVGI
jgi:hypothetical protein